MPSTRPVASSPVIETLFRFLDALESADASALRRLIHTSESSRSQPLGRDALVSLIVAQKKLETSAAARFPAQARRFHRGLELICSPADRNAIAGATVIIDESPIARVVLPNETQPISFRRSSSGEWQVLLNVIDVDLDDSQAGPSSIPQRVIQLRVERLAAIAAAVDAVATRIETGEYADILAAESDLLDRMAAARADYRKKVDEMLNRRRMNAPKFPVPD